MAETGRVTLVNAIGVTAPDTALTSAAKIRVGTVNSALTVDGTVEVLVDEDAIVEA